MYFERLRFQFNVIAFLAVWWIAFVCSDGALAQTFSFAGQISFFLMFAAFLLFIGRAVFDKTGADGFLDWYELDGMFFWGGAAFLSQMCLSRLPLWYL